ncbi:Major facilitator superfamily [Artemisia annua]|uniref:Major facilitator superfamily n=1 Tax=Artemisia annua TaxID=35608 RepID=A0A2U1PPI4_ARTAN|nr:Major facilitator superfamily [Artemisia annua]
MWCGNIHVMWYAFRILFQPDIGLLQHRYLGGATLTDWWLQPWPVLGFAAIFENLGYFNMITLAASVSWRGSLTQVVVAAMAAVCLWYYIHAPEPLRDDHPLSVQECIHEDVNVYMSEANAGLALSAAILAGHHGNVFAAMGVDSYLGRATHLVCSHVVLVALMLDCISFALNKAGNSSIFALFGEWGVWFRTAAIHLLSRVKADIMKQVLYLASALQILAVFVTPSFRNIVSKQVGPTEQGKAQGCITGLNSLPGIISPLVFSHLTGERNASNICCFMIRLILANKVLHSHWNPLTYVSAFFLKTKENGNDLFSGSKP